MIATRYPELEPKAIVSKLLGSDIDTEDHEDDESVGVTGKQGGRLLACYLFSVKDDAALTFLAQGIKAWLEAQLPKYAVIHPVQTSCLKNAVSSVEFLPELERGLAAAAATRAPAPDFGDDEELEEARRARPPPAPPPPPPPPDF